MISEGHKKGDTIKAVKTFNKYNKSFGTIIGLDSYDSDCYKVSFNRKSFHRSNLLYSKILLTEKR